MGRRIVFSACVWLAACAATVNTASPVHVPVTFDAQSPVPASVLASVLREARQIWAPYGIVIDSDRGAPSAAITLPLVVVLDTNRNAGDGDTGLGAIQFAADGIPHATVTVYYRALTQMLTNAVIAGADASQWPPALRDHVVGRALGRMLAHELGHFVLRSPHHTTTGLMRPRQHISALTDSSRKGFALTGVDRARLRIVVAAHSRALETLAGGDAAFPARLPVSLATAVLPE